MSIAAIRTWDAVSRAELSNVPRNKRRKLNTQDGKFTILEALSATGLRSIRYAKEIPNVSSIIANDLDAGAVDTIRRNVQLNGLSTELVRPTCSDAMKLMYAHTSELDRFNVIDLDPYGSASVFLDGAVQAVADGGLLCVTCTDLMVLAGNNYPETCFAKYGGTSVKAEYCHEMALRLVLHAIRTSGARYKRSIVPVLSCSIDFYVRVFVRVYTSAQTVKHNASQTSLVYNCTKCRSFYLQPLGRVTESKFQVAQSLVEGHCEHCGGTFHVGGPCYNGPLHDKAFVKEMLDHVNSTTDSYGTKKRMQGMLAVIHEEIDAPLYYSLSGITKSVHCTNPRLDQFCSALLHQNYQVSISHAQPASIKTNAPPSVIWDIMRSWVKLNPVTMANIAPDSAAARILSKEPTVLADFSLHEHANPPSRTVKLVRFQENPTKNWGPKARHGKQKE